MAFLKQERQTQIRSRLSNWPGLVQLVVIAALAAIVAVSLLPPALWDTIREYGFLAMLAKEVWKGRKIDLSSQVDQLAELAGKFSGE